ncbi:MAG: DUF2007 domain-containing protein [Planctomycetes bacterium]|nr:DUF2007 domain-containing protein [Planctomycetota bacterium]
MASDFTLIYEPPDPYTLALVRSLLEDRGIPYRTRERGISPTAWGLPGDSDLATMYVQVLVERGRLEEAKQLLCEHDIICEVSERLRARGFETLAAPLLSKASDDLDRLVRYLRVNNKATVQAILEDIRNAQGGGPLLLRILFHLLGRDEGITLGRLARFLNERPPGGTKEVIEARLPVIDAASRRDLAAVLEYLRTIDPDAILVGLLRDPDAGVREAAIESLFATHGDDCGYEPDAPEEEREAAVRRWEELL